MKRIILFLLFGVLSIGVYAIPANNGVWKNIKLSDGTVVMAQLCGDEYVHFWRTEDGTCYTESNDNKGTYNIIDIDSLKEFSRTRHMKIKFLKKNINRSSLRLASDVSKFEGVKKGLIILVNFKDNSFSETNPQTTFNNIINTRGYKEGNYKGSVADYFYDQSDGKFQLSFDVVGPITLSQNMDYYGSNVSQEDNNPYAMVSEACNAIDNIVNFNDYDWDGDGIVDEVFLIYAGYNEAEGGDSETIWPHMGHLVNSENGVLTLDGVTINTYACSSELSGYSETNIAGIGTICHEFSHCLGFQDIYDVCYDGNYGMGHWDIMSSGNRNGNSFCPAGYTAYERITAGWITPIELTEDAVVTNMKPINEGGDAYIIYNQANRNEYYLLENRQQTGWDAFLPGAGLQITHVDYDEKVWEYNIINSIIDNTMYENYEDCKNDHQRMTIFHADNDDDFSYWNTTSHSYLTRTEDTDLYPSNGNNCLTSNSTPRATTYNKNTDGVTLMGKAVTDITKNSDGTVSFSFKSTSPYEAPADGIYITETFDNCAGTGGNDDLWGGSKVAVGEFKSDMSGWLANYSYGANKCARFGAVTKVGEVYSPEFFLVGDAMLDFVAATWTSTNATTGVDTSDGTSIDVYLNDNLVGSYTLGVKQWNEFYFKITGSGSSRIRFVPTKRWFLDYFSVFKDPFSTIVNNVTVEKSFDKRIYSIDGRYMGTDFGVLGKGLYIQNGKKVVK